nr:MAG TPA: hypothetical protein [Caudoviricetes sp.]
MQGKLQALRKIDSKEFAIYLLFSYQICMSLIYYKYE